jgi:DNA transposition AAA+ family ATPase
MNNEFTIENCIIYLENEYFTDIRFKQEKENKLYFIAIDEDDQLKEIEFESVEVMEENRICVSVKENEQWNILEILID